MTRNWGSESLARFARTVPTWQTPSASYSNNYQWLAALTQAWATGFIVGGRTAFGSGVRLDTIAPSFMPYPRAGWGFVTTASSIIGADNEPQTTPLQTATGTLASATVLPPAGSLQRVLDQRTTRILRPLFARRKP